MISLMLRIIRMIILMLRVIRMIILMIRMITLLGQDDGLCFMAHGSWLMAHGEWLMAHGQGGPAWLWGPGERQAWSDPGPALPRLQGRAGTLGHEP